MEKDLKRLRRQLDDLLGKRKFVKDTVIAEQERLKSQEEDYEHGLQAQQHLQEIAQQVQDYSHSQIAQIVSKCLSAVFEIPYEFRIEFEKKRGKTEARFVYYQNGYRLSPLLTSGGVRNVTSFALRVASLVLSNPPMRRLLVLDEPFTGVDVCNRPKIKALLEMLAEEMGMQIIMITHDEELAIGKVVEI